MKPIDLKDYEWSSEDYDYEDEDVGIGSYEFWGDKGNDVQMRRTYELNSISTVVDAVDEVEDAEFFRELEDLKAGDEVLVPSTIYLNGKGNQPVYLDKDAKVKIGKVKVTRTHQGGREVEIWPKGGLSADGTDLIEARISVFSSSEAVELRESMQLLARVEGDHQKLRG